MLASVTACGEKLPLFAIADEKTARAEQNQLGSDAMLVTDHSASGRGTVEVFRHYRDWLTNHYPGRIPPECQLHVTRDSYSVHRSDDIKKYARGRGIQLWFIRAGFTDARHPLNRAVFGAIKGMVRRIFEGHFRQSPNRRVTKATALQISKAIWAQLSPASIGAGWSIYEDDFGPDDDAHDADWEEHMRPPEIDWLIRWHSPCDKSSTKNRPRTRLSPGELRWAFP
jgi:hypothetical protein